MYGAIIGDIAGSRFEFDNYKAKDFEIFHYRSEFTDDTVMTVAVADALMTAKEQGLVGNGAKQSRDDEAQVKNLIIDAMHKWGPRYMNAGYGGRFYEWLAFGLREPYNSWGNGSAMRVSPAGWIVDDLDEARRLARWSAEVTHNHPEGIKGAEAVASAIFLARRFNAKADQADAKADQADAKAEIKDYITSEFGYDLDRTCDEIRPDYEFDVSCQGSVPESIIAFLEGEDFEDVIRTVVSLGGDCDTTGAIAGSIAEAFYGVPDDMKRECDKKLPDDILSVVRRWEAR